MLLLFIFIVLYLRVKGICEINEPRDVSDDDDDDDDDEDNLGETWQIAILLNYNVSSISSTITRLISHSKRVT